MSTNNAYKQWHKPNTNDNAKTKQGYYKISNTSKYIGDPGLCIYRSSWEFNFCKWCDFSPSILKWSAEPISVQYFDRSANLDECKKYGLNPNDPRNWKVRNYNVDFWLQIDKGQGVLEKWFVEIKPAYKLKKPIPPTENAPLKEQKRFLSEAKDYLNNEAKWEACKHWATKNDAKFYVFTEETLAALIGHRFNYIQK